MTALDQTDEPTDLLTRDRRRPGRQDVSPELVDLLRGTGPAPGDAEPDSGEAMADRDEALRPARGLALGLLIVAPFWCVLAMGIRALL